MNVLTPHESGFIHGARACYGVPCPAQAPAAESSGNAWPLSTNTVQRAQHDRALRTRRATYTDSRELRP